MVLVPLRVPVLQEHEDGEEDVDPELEDLEVRSSHRSCRPRDVPSPLLRILTSDITGRHHRPRGGHKYSQLMQNAPLCSSPSPWLSRNASTQKSLSKIQRISTPATPSILSQEMIQETCPTRMVGDTEPVPSRSTRSHLLYVSHSLLGDHRLTAECRGQMRTLSTGRSTTNYL